MATVGQLILQRLGVDPIVVERLPASFGQDVPPPPPDQMVPDTGMPTNVVDRQKSGAITVGGSGGTPDNPADLPFPFNLLPKLPPLPGIGGSGSISPWGMIDWKLVALGGLGLVVGGWVLVKIVGSAASAAPHIVKLASPAALL